MIIFTQSKTIFAVKKVEIVVEKVSLDMEAIQQCQKRSYIFLWEDFPLELSHIVYQGGKNSSFIYCRIRYLGGGAY